MEHSVAPTRQPPLRHLAPCHCRCPADATILPCPRLPPSSSGNGVQLEYKYVVRSERDKSAVRWKEGNNCYLAVPTQGRLKVHDTWDDSMREVEVSRRLRQ